LNFWETREVVQSQVRIGLQSLMILITMDLSTVGAWSLGILLGVMTFLFIVRIVLTWYPQVESEKFPYNLIVVPTEPFLAPTRKLIPPLGGVDISPIIWVAIFSLVRELLLGQQGLITMALY
jgi:YggT family protein